MDLSHGGGFYQIQYVTPKPPPPTAKIVDGYSDLRPGVAFDSDPCGQLENNRHYLLHAVLERPDLQAKMVSEVLETEGGEQKVVWAEKEQRRWLEKSRKFLEKLAVLIHLTYGNPARGHEFTMLKIVNHCVSGRNYIWKDGNIAIMTGYHKSRNITGKEKIIFRFLPPHVSQLLITYLNVIRPFENMLINDMYGATAHSIACTYLLHRKGKQWTTVDLTESLQAEFARHLTASKIGTASYRHIQIAISKLYRGGASILFDEGDEIQDIQAAHSTRTAQVHYAISDFRDASAIIPFQRASHEWWEIVGCWQAPQRDIKIVRRKRLAPKAEFHLVLTLTDENNKLRRQVAKLQAQLDRTSSHDTLDPALSSPTTIVPQKRRSRRRSDASPPRKYLASSSTRQWSEQGSPGVSFTPATRRHTPEGDNFYTPQRQAYDDMMPLSGDLLGRRRREAPNTPSRVGPNVSSPYDYNQRLENYSPIPAPSTLTPGFFVGQDDRER